MSLTPEEERALIAKARQSGMTRLTVLAEHGVDIDAPCDGCDGTGTVYGYNCCAQCGPIVELPCDDCNGAGWAA